MRWALAVGERETLVYPEAHPLTLDEKLWGNRPTACDIAVQITGERRSTHPLPVLHDHCSGLL